MEICISKGLSVIEGNAETELGQFPDKSFDFVIKTPPAAVQLLEAAKVKKGSGEPHVKKVAKVTWDQVKTIAEDKMVDLNAFTSTGQVARHSHTGSIVSIGG